MSITSELRHEMEIIRRHAVDYGLDFFEVIFEVLDWKQVNEVAALGGFPKRYPHWRFGMEYERLSKSYAYGLSKIYEMVINTDPCYAYLLHSNAMVDQKMVMAHVYGHSDFFKCNQCFAGTNRKMMDEMANHRTRVLRYIDEVGYDKVEAWIDVCLSLENLIDVHGSAITRAPSENAEGPREVQRLGTNDKRYLERYINPPEFIEQQRAQIAAEAQMAQKVPEHPQRDVLAFLCEYAPMEAWERDILFMLREEALYFAPQGQTKIMNEGWASYWHTKIMTQHVLKDHELIDYADHHSGTVAMQPGGPLNPYKIGIELFRDIEERWNQGRFGMEYEHCTDMKAKAEWNRETGLGREKIFEIRRNCSDITFIDQYLTPEFCQKHKLFVFAYNVQADQYEIADRTFQQVKQKLLQQLTNAGNPIIDAVDANYNNRGELLLKHAHHGDDLRRDYAQQTLENLYRVWRRPVNIETLVEGVPRILAFDGESHKDFRP